MCIDIRGIEGHCLLVRRNRRIGVGQLLIDRAQIVVGSGILRFELNCLAQGCNRIVIAALSTKDYGELAIGRKAVGRQRNRLLVGRGRKVVLALAHVQVAQRNAGFDIVWIELHSLGDVPNS